MDKLLLEWFQSIFPDCPQLTEDLSHTLEDNPGRISRAYRSLFEGYFLEPENIVKVTMEIPKHDFHGLVTSTNIPFMSFCAHHFLPFFGTVDIVYEPGAYIIGIGKMPRLVECRAKRFQLQESLVKSLCEDMMEFAKANGAYVRSTARHICVCYRGPEVHTTVNTTTYSMGSLSEPVRTQEVLVALNSSNPNGLM
jgi:GTP cyclohydrolase I